MLNAYIFCGGRGTRMQSYDNTLPKPLIKIKNKPLVSYIIDHYNKYSIKKIYLLTGHKNHFFKKYKFPNNVEIIYTGLHSTTLERLNKIKSFVEDENFFLTYGDSYTDINILSSLKKHLLSKNMISISYFKYQLPYGRFFKSKKMLSLIEKENLFLNSGFYVCNKKIFDYISKFKSLESELIPYLLKKKLSSNVIEVKNWFPVDDKYDVSTFTDYLNRKK